jgi:hypothetical protein
VARARQQRGGRGQRCTIMPNAEELVGNHRYRDASTGIG